MVAGVAAVCGADVVAGRRLARHGPGALGEGSGVVVSIGECDLVLVDPVGHGPPDAADGASDGASGAQVPEGAGVGPVADGHGGPVLIHLPGEADEATGWARAWGAEHVVELPAGQAWLRDLLEGLARPSSVVAVLGSVGGAGATTVALALAAAAGEQAPETPVSGPPGPRGCLLVDVDPGSTGLDLPLGITDAEAARWSSIPDGSGVLVSESLRVSLPRVGEVVVLTGEVPAPVDPRVEAVVRAGRADFAATILDAGRGPVPSALREGDAAILVVPATLSGVVGAHRIIAQLPTRRVALAVRPTGWLPTAEVAAQVGSDRVVALPYVRGLAERMDCGDVLAGRTGRALRRIGVELWGALR
jgi:hypothetical protein